MSKPTPYSDRILKVAPGHDPRHVEAFLRLEHGTLDRLPPTIFDVEVAFAVICIDVDPAGAERLAQSYGF